MKFARLVCLGALAGMAAFGDLSKAGDYHSSGSHGSYGSAIVTAGSCAVCAPGVVRLLCGLVCFLQRDGSIYFYLARGC